MLEAVALTLLLLDTVVAEDSHWTTSSIFITSPDPSTSTASLYIRNNTPRTHTIATSQVA